MRKMLAIIAFAVPLSLAACGDDDKTTIIQPPQQSGTVVVPQPSEHSTVVVPR